MSDKSPPPSTAEFVAPPQTLQGKVVKGGPGAVNKEALAKAEAVIEDLADDYLDWVREDFVRLDTAFAQLKSGSGDIKEDIDALFSVVHDMKGQGGSFGYPLMTQISDLLCGLLENVENPGKREFKMMKVYMDAMHVVISHELKNDGGNEGRQLLMGLSLVKEKF